MGVLSIALMLMMPALSAAASKLNYGLVFDAGSSGTRIHVYTWRTGGGALQRNNPRFPHPLLTWARLLRGGRWLEGRVRPGQR